MLAASVKKVRLISMNIKMNITKISHLLLSGITLYTTGWTFISSAEFAKSGCADDSKLIFFLVPFLFIIVGIIRILTTRKKKFNFLYKIHDFICGLLILIPLYVNGTTESMNIGIFMSLVAIVIILSGICYLLFKKTNLKHRTLTT